MIELPERRKWSGNRHPIYPIITMKTKTLFFLVFSIFFLFACAKAPGIHHADNSAGSTLIPLQEALDSLEKTAFQLGLDKTKSGTNRTYNTKGIYVVNKEGTSTKSGVSQEGPLLYVVNFDNDLGYAVLSASTTIGMNVICIAEKGHLSEAVFTAGRQLLERPKDSNINEPVVQFKNTYDSLFIASLILSGTVSPRQLELPDPEEPIIGGGAGAPGIVAPMVYTKWNQNISPYNNETPGNQPAGCVVTALAQILAYEEYPTQIDFGDGTFGNWTDMKTVYTYPQTYYSGTQEGQNQVAKLFRLLGLPEYCDVHYNDGSWALSSNAKSALQDLGYTNVKLHFSLTDFRSLHSKVLIQLINGHPVFTSGLNSGSIYGHAWVIDGFQINYYHINWGWGGAADGYYNSGVFNTDNRAFYTSLDPGSTASDSHNYTSYYHIITYDRP